MGDTGIARELLICTAQAQVWQFMQVLLRHPAFEPRGSQHLHRTQVRCDT